MDDFSRPVASLHSKTVRRHRIQIDTGITVVELENALRDVKDKLAKLTDIDDIEWRDSRGRTTLEFEYEEET